VGDRVSAPRYPALDLWRIELRANKRTTTDFDVVWQAACCEQWAIDFLGWGLPNVAAAFREDARRIVLEAVRAPERQQVQGRRYREKP
jgi:hypothetical protein